MDVMLNFFDRNADLEQQLTNRGHEILLPARKRRLPNPDVFSLSLGFLESPSEFEECLASVTAAMLSIQDILAAHPEISGRTELDWGIEADDVGFVKGFRFDPDLMRLLSALGITLCVSVYGCHSEDAED